jgi:tetratricopeptide (TPR) repeat protein
MVRIVTLARIPVSTVLVAGLCVCAAWRIEGADLNSEIQQHFAAAQAAQRSGSLDAATREYQAVLKLKPDFAEAHMNLGLVLHAQGKFDQSSIALGKSLQLKPGLFAAELFQAINYCKLGRPPEAVPLLARAAREQPGNKQARFWYGSALIEAGKPGAAVLELENAAGVLRDDVDILQLLGEAYQKAAREQSEKVKSTEPNSPERRLLLAESFLTQDEWMAAEVYYKRLVEHTPVPAGAHLGLGTTLLRQGKAQQALPHFEAELRADPFSVEAYVGLAESLVVSGKLPDALDQLERAMAIRPGQARAAVESAGPLPDTATDSTRASYQAALDKWGKAERRSAGTLLGVALASYRLGKADDAQAQFQSLERALPPRRAAPEPASRRAALECVRRRQYEEAIATLRRLLQAQPNDSQLRLALAQALLETHEPGQAARELRLLLQREPRHVIAHLWLGKAYRDLALGSFEKIVTLQPDSYRAHQLLADAYAAKKQYEKAIAEYRAALEKRPNLPGLHLEVGRIHLLHMRLDEAAAEFQKELEINPFDADANTDLGGIYVNQDQPAKAVPLLERAIQVQPRLMEAHRRLGKAYYALGQFENAEAEFRNVAAEDDDGSTHYLLARTYRQLGRTREAEEALQTVTRLKAARLKEAQERAERAQKLEP